MCRPKGHEAGHRDAGAFRVFPDEMARSLTPARRRDVLIPDDASWRKGKEPDRHFFEPLYLSMRPLSIPWRASGPSQRPGISATSIAINKAAIIKKAGHALCELMNGPAKVASGAAPIEYRFRGIP
jgi:hypothetical protein